MASYIRRRNSALSAFLRGFGVMHSSIDVVNRRRYARTDADAVAESLRESWDKVGEHLYDAIEQLGSQYEELPRLDSENTASQLPPPELLQACETAMPGSVDQILTIAEDMQKRQMRVETTELIAGFAAVICSFALGAYMISSGLEWQGFAVIVGVTVAMSAARIYTDINVSPRRAIARQYDATRLALPANDRDDGDEADLLAMYGEAADAPAEQSQH